MRSILTELPRTGLANRVVAEDDVEDAARELVGGIAEHESAVVRELKSATYVPE